MRRILPLLALVAGIGSPAVAGRNANGAMVVHTDNSVNYTETAVYCDTSFPLPTTCQGLNPTSNKAPGTISVIWLIAAFRSEANPAVTALQFGIDHSFPSGQGYFSGYAACGPSPLELPDTGWPESGFGNLVAYSNPVFDKLFKFYWFAVNHDDDASYIATRTYPSTNEAKFVDDGNPPFEDLCTHFGTLRWDIAGVNDCPSLGVGACCFMDGSCQIVDAATCASQGGSYRGDDTLCDPNPCPQPAGACCFDDGRCRLLIAADCSRLGGSWQGMNTDCDPNPCPPPVGACCFSDGHCTLLSPDDCLLQGGSWRGVHTDCDPNPCMGACCFDDGRCTLLNTDDCSLQGGSWRGMNTNCDPNPCPQPPGACCYLDGTCRVTTLATCDGTWQGVDTVCDPNPCTVAMGACCLPDGTCQVTSLADCAGAWQGMDTVCDPNPCPQPVGACCLPDGSCYDLPQADCLGGGGVWHGMGTSCDPNPCPPPTGACCFAGGLCTVLTRADCLAQGGSYYDDLTTCDPNPCILPTGACCFPDGSCQVLTEEHCPPYNGIYQGDGTICDPNPCPQPTGACCYQDGSCQITIEAACTGTWRGMNTVCDPNPCTQPSGACCYPNGTCRVTTQAACNGEWQGMNTVCNPNPCPEPTGACCYPDGSCQVTTQPACSGAWQGMNTICDPNPCPPCVLAVTSPNGSEDWQAGSVHTITWTRFDGCGDLVKIELLRKVPVRASNVMAYQSCRTIATGAANTGSYPWTVQDCGTGANQYKILITELSGEASDMSDQPFRISPRIPGRIGLDMSRVLFMTPFQPNGQIEFDLGESGPVRVAIFNVHGQRVRDLVDETYPAGQHRVFWDARTDAGADAVAGIYYLRIQLDGTQTTRKLVLVR